MEHVVCQLCDEVIPEGLQVAQRRVVRMQDVGPKVLGHVEVITTILVEKSRHESQSGAMQGERQVQLHRLPFADG